ncbi:hypothetical protein Daus18300_011730 [Diaporthe australafricana]|uniref:Uncharacterized protein n=1 Tax=Diaporthe australafricana TaxID=127596 RepID=A0ABR3W5I0_9PEZI
MRKTLRKLFGRRPKSTLASFSPVTKCHPNRSSAPPALGRGYSVGELTTYVVTDHFDCQAQHHATTQLGLAKEDTTSYEVLSRIRQFREAERRLQAKFPQNRIVDAGKFPGNMELLEGVSKEDTRFFVAMDSEDSSQYVAVNLVIFSAANEPACNPGAPQLQPMVIAEDALSHLLRQWQVGGVSDGFLAIVSIGTDISVHVFKTKEGLVSLSG